MMKMPMRTAIAAMAMVLLASAAHAQAKGKRQQQDEPKTEDVAAEKGADEAYQKALNAVPAKQQKIDPWGKLR